METANFDEINDLIGKKEFEQAKNHLQNLLEQDGQNAEALKMLGLCNINLGLFSEAKGNFETAIKYNNDDASSWFYLANCHDNLHEVTEAKNAYFEVIKLRENFLDAYKNLSVLFLRMRKEDEAVEIAQKALLITQEDYIFYYVIGAALLAKRQMAESISYFEEALKLSPDHVQIHNNLGTAYLSIGDYQKSYDFFIKASELEPKNSITYYNIGSILQIQGKLSESCEFYEKAYVLEPNENYLTSLAFAEYKSGQYEKAIKHYKILVTHHPEKQNFQYNLACCYEMAGEYIYAIGILDQLILLNPKSSVMAQKLAGLYLKINQPLKAKEIYRRIIAQGMVSVEIYYEYALLCTKTGDIDTAETILKKVLSLNPDFALGHKDLGIIFLTKRLFDYAKDEFEKALKLDEENPLILFEYANFLHATNNFQKAKEFYQKAQDNAPESADVKIFSAINFIALNELEKALECAAPALEKFPEDTFMLFVTGKINYLMKNFDKAKQFLIKSYEKNQNSETGNILALTCFELGEFEQANDIFEKLLKENPLNINILFNSAKCFVELSNIGAAKKRLKKVLEIFPEFDEAKKLLNKTKEGEKL